MFATMITSYRCAPTGAHGTAGSRSTTASYGIPCRSRSRASRHARRGPLRSPPEDDCVEHPVRAAFDARVVAAAAEWMVPLDDAAERVLEREIPRHRVASVAARWRLPAECAAEIIANVAFLQTEPVMIKASASTAKGPLAEAAHWGGRRDLGAGPRHRLGSARRKSV